MCRILFKLGTASLAGRLAVLDWQAWPSILTLEDASFAFPSDLTGRCDSRSNDLPKDWQRRPSHSPVSTPCDNFVGRSIRLRFLISLHMPSSLITLCSSHQLASLGLAEGIVAVCDSPVTGDQIAASPAFKSWPESTSMLILALGEETTGTHQGHNLPASASRLLEAPFRTSVVLCRSASVESLTAETSVAAVVRGGTR